MNASDRLTSSHLSKFFFVRPLDCYSPLSRREYLFEYKKITSTSLALDCVAFIIATIKCLCAIHV